MGIIFFHTRNLWMTDKFNWEVSPSIGVVKSSLSSQCWCFWAAFKPSDLSFAHLGRQLEDFVPCAPTDLQEPQPTPGLPPEIPKLKQKVNSKTKRGGQGFCLGFCSWWGLIYTTESSVVKWGCALIYSSIFCDGKVLMNANEYPMLPPALPPAQCSPLLCCCRSHLWLHHSGEIQGLLWF